MPETRRTRKTDSLDLFQAGLKDQVEREQPLAARLRPKSLDDFVGQDHILGPGRLLRRAIQADQLSSLIFYGPPGTGKTTLAHVISSTTSSHFISINAVLAGVADIRGAVDEAQERRALHNQKTILFVDEVHRFNKAQQDALLPWVENGTVILIGATTENPYFSVNAPLVSRSRIFQLRAMDAADLRMVVQRALKDPQGYKRLRLEIDPQALDHLVDVANGDARTLLNAVELAVETTEPDSSGRIYVDLAVAEESIQRRAVLYDKEGDYHFDTISAFIKSMRGSDPDATMYWLARMVYAGEDPQFIFRRMLIFASEDVGAADPSALQVVTAAAQTFDRVGLPEGRFALGQAALHLATAPKSNSVFAFFDALAAVEKEQESEVPNHLKDASRDSEGFGHGAGYQYPHAFRDHWVAQQYLPDALQGRVFYQPSDQGQERVIRDVVARRRELHLAASAEDGSSDTTFAAAPAESDAQQAWLRRASGDVGTYLEGIRDHLFEGLRVKNHFRVLDLNAQTGLFSWEALRRVPQGAVWSLCENATIAVGMREMSAHLNEIDRPTILEGELGDLEEAIRSVEESMRFETIVGRDALGSRPDKAEIFRTLRRRTAATAQLALVETVRKRAQRLTDLVNLEDSLDADLASRVRAAEEAIYADETNPQINWDGEDLVKALAEAGFMQATCRLQTIASLRRMTPKLLEHWFSQGGDKLKTFAWHLRRHLEELEVVEIRKLFERQLVNKDVKWTMTYAIVTASSQGESPDSLPSG